MARSKRRNKKNKVSPQQLEGQRRNEYRRKIIRLAKLAGAEEALPWISKKDWDMLCNCRFRAVRVEAGNDLVPKQILNEARKQLDILLSEGRVSLREDGPEMSLKDYVAVAVRVYLYLTDEKEPCPLIVREKFVHLIEAVEDEEQSPPNLLLANSAYISMQVSRIHRRMYYFRYNIESNDAHVNECLQLYGFQHHKRKLRIRDVTRLVYRVGWCIADQGTVWSKVTGRQFGYDNKLADLPVRVYIQAHALQRLKERIDVVATSHLHFYLYQSLEDLRVTRNSSGQQMIDFYYEERKLGYFMFDLLGKNLVIRTFLFLTMDGTPEGEILQKELGIEAADKKYLAIDKLSTFIVSDIRSYPEVKQYFVNAGCEQLFDWEGADLGVEEKTEHAAVIQSYLERAKALREQDALETEEEPADVIPRLLLPEQSRMLLLPQSVSA